VIAVYAVVRGPLAGPLGVGVQQERLRAVPASGFLVVVGDVAAPPRVTARALVSHDRLVRRLGAGAVLPVRFGAVLPDVRALRRVTRARRAELADALALVAGCEQFTLRVFAPKRRSEGRSGTGPGARWLGARSPIPPQIVPLCRAVAPLVKDERAEKARGVASIYHLVARADRRAYRAALARAMHDIAGAKVVVSGPWPAYAFAEAV
jgi:hypothetical protein